MDDYSDVFLEEKEAAAAQTSDAAGRQEHEGASPRDRGSCTAKHHKKQVLTALLCLLLTALVLTLALVLGNKDDSDESNGSLTSSAIDTPAPSDSISDVPPSNSSISSCTKNTSSDCGFVMGAIDSVLPPTPTTLALVSCEDDVVKCGIIMGYIDPVLPPSTREQLEVSGKCQSWAREWLLGANNADLLATNASNLADRFQQRFALAVIYCSLNGNGWSVEDTESTWLSSLHECDWAMPAGVDPCDRFGRFEILHSFGNMTGLLPDEIGLLTPLKELDLSDNKISGTIPEFLSRLGELDTLDLSSNQLEGTIPDLVWKFEDMSYMSLGNNDFSASTIPRSVPLTSPNLHTVLLSSSNIEGVLPSDFGDFDWKRVDLSGNRIEGPIPVYMFRNNRLMSMKLNNNSFHGEIPSGLGDERNLLELTLYNNPELNGDINEICKNFVSGYLVSAQVDKANVVCECCSGGGGGLPEVDLGIVFNHTSCPGDPTCDTILAAIDPVLPSDTRELVDTPGTCQKDALEWMVATDELSTLETDGETIRLVDLPAYRLQQRFALAVVYCMFDREAWLLRKATLSKVHECAWNFRGRYTPLNHECDSFEGYQAFTNFGLEHGRRAVGPLPKEISMLTSLKELSLFDGAFSGAIPKEYERLTNLSVLCLSSNRLQGEIPDFVWAMNLKILDLSNNKFSGTLPENLNILAPNLQSLYLGWNLLSSTISVAFSFMNLTTLSLSYNQLTGTIPEDINGGYMEVLALFENSLTGKIPINIDMTGSMAGLLLSRNYLTGTVPDLNSSKLLTLLLADNLLSGVSPSGHYPYLARAELQGNNITGDLNGLCKPLFYEGRPNKTDFFADLDEISCECCRCCHANETWSDNCPRIGTFPFRYRFPYSHASSHWPYSYNYRNYDSLVPWYFEC